ncbi:MAG: DUF3488 domain-containing protein [Opitutaceae bacterium]|nr:DUF3488 domain-containing protein [Opitutaceae bacterium]
MRFFAVEKQPQLSLEELCHVRWLLGGLLALLSVWTLFHLEVSIWPFAAVATVTIVGVMLHPALPGKVPRLVWRLLVPLIVVVFVVDVLSNEIVLSLVRLNTMLVLYRAVSYRERRDDLQLIALSLFLAVLTGVLTVSIVFVVQILLFTAVGMVLLFVINVVDDALAGAPVSTVRWVRIPRRRLLLRLRQAADVRVVVLAGGLFAAVVLVTALIFLAVPRFEVSNPINFLALNRKSSLTGFSENVALGEVTDIQTDDGVAMRVDVRAGAVVPEEPYWRMVALDEYSAGAFRMSPSARSASGDRALPYLDLAPMQQPVGDRDGRPRENGRIVIFLEPGVSRYLPQPGGFSEIQFRETQEIIPNDVLRVYAMREASAGLLSYQIEGADFGGVIPDPFFAQERTRAATPSGRRAAPRGGSLSLGGAGLEPAARGGVAYPHTTLALPEAPEAREYLAGIVAEITGGREVGAQEFARLACVYLDRRHSYSRQVRLPPVEGTRIEDPVIRWLQAGAGGHCEFFAAAFTLLGRAAGHPVRVIAGFKGGTWNGYENYFMVRHAHAHAWCEIYDGAGAWLRVDPTPGAGGIGTQSEPLNQAQVALASDRSTSAYLDSLRMIWYRRIVNFDQRSQQGVISSLRTVGRTARVWSEAVVQVVREQYAAWQKAPLSFASKGDILVLSIVLFLVAVLLKRLGLGKSDVLEWFQRGQMSTRRRAGLLLQRLEARVARPPRRRSWDEERALELAGQLMIIRFGRVETWPEPLKTFRAVRRIL